MYFGMNNKAIIMCPYLKGTDHGAECAIVQDIVRNIENADIKFCMSRHFESCHVYFTSLRRENSLRSQMQAR
jgi:hypothetical protein